MGKIEKTFYWLCFVFALYAVIGFKIIPTILQDELVKNLDKNLTLKTSIEKVEFNPFTLNAKIHGFKLSDENNNSDISFKLLSINFALMRSIEKKHISFQSITLDGTNLSVIQEKDGSINLTKIVKPTNEEKKEEKSSMDIKFLISKISLTNANIKYIDNTKEKPYIINLSDINYTIYDLGTYKNILSSNNLKLKLNEHTNVAIGAAFKLEPFKVYGKVEIEDLRIKEFLDYKKELFNFELNEQANINLVLNYNLDMTNKLDLNLNSEQFDINNINIKQYNKTITSLKKLDIKTFDFDLLSQNIKLDGISINELNANMIMDKSGLNFAKLIYQSKEEKNEETLNKEDKKAQRPWIVNLSNLNLNNSDFVFNDKINNSLSSAKNTKANLSNLNIVNSDIKIDNFSLISPILNFEDKKNQLQVDTKNIKVTVNKLSLKNENLNIDKISFYKENLLFKDLKADLNLKVSNTNLDIINLLQKESNISIDDINLKKTALNLIDKKANLQVDAKNLDLNIHKISNNQNGFKIVKTNLNKPQISVILGKSQKEKEESKRSVENKKDNSKKNQKETKLDIGPVNINNAIFIFEDKNLPIPFVTKISDLNGKISEFKNSKNSTTDLQVDGLVDRYGVAKITGIVDPNNIKILTDINMKFKNIAMENFTPYTGKFVGRELKSGKLDLDLNYNIEKSNLDAKNNIVITKLELGEEVQSPDAVSLPLGIAIALLEDKNGIIDINLPVSGNVDDPQFAIGSIIWKAFVNLMTKAVTAPFSLLGAMFDFSEDEIKTVKFDFTEDKITPIQKETLDKISQILSSRPELAIKIAPSYDNEELKALKEKKYIAKDKNYKKLKKEEFDKLVEKEVVEKKELENIAKNRIVNIKEYLIKDKKIDEKQIILTTDIETSNSSIDLKIDQTK
uniref:DUF748 domain-containing protein n=1 Tax=Aliarcobacter sp. TaxID=2321116 RepID=UPI004048323E